tara:strand:- start:564 stop:1046 length:483 start_codon:yes stop_codon:yes gene_type:complete
MRKHLIYIIIMSSASGLSAAKRRRAGSNFSLDNNSNDNNVNNGNNGNNNSRLRMQDVVISHEQRIQDIEKIFTDNENIVINNSDNNTEHNDKINTRLDEIENKLVPDVDDKENIEYYKNKIKTMEEQIAELKKTMMSIQNIAMDTSTSLMEYKNSVTKTN